MILEDVAHAIGHKHNLSVTGHAGAGAFKKVFEASDRANGRYAIKVVAKPGTTPRSAREIEALRQCDHPGIAKVLHVDRHSIGSEHFEYSIEEYLAGGTLAKRIESGPLDDSETRLLGRLLTDAIGHLSQRGYVHRDIKPENIMFRNAKEPVLVDFGLVRALAQVSLTQSWLAAGPGTPYYAAPEQLNNEKRMIDWRTDQFALGVTLAVARFSQHPYQALGEPMFAGTTVARVAQRGSVSSEFIESARSAGFEVLIKMVEPWPVKRFRRPEELFAHW